VAVATALVNSETSERDDSGGSSDATSSSASASTNPLKRIADGESLRKLMSVDRGAPAVQAFFDRLEGAAEAGDIEATVALLEGTDAAAALANSAAARETISHWLEQARQRVAADAAAELLRTRATTLVASIQ
jgi:putative aminopeptidase FrvX